MSSGCRSTASHASGLPVTDGLLLIYPIQPVSDDLMGDDIEVTHRPIMGFAVSFPWSPGAPLVDYVVNQRFVEELAGDWQG